MISETLEDRIEALEAHMNDDCQECANLANELEAFKEGVDKELRWLIDRVNNLSGANHE